MANYEYLLQFCNKPADTQLVEALIQGKKKTDIAIEMKVARSNVTRRLQRIQKRAKDYSAKPEYIKTLNLPEPFIPKGVSTFYDEDGNVSRQWVKTDVAKQDQIKMLQEFVEGFVPALPTIPEIEPLDRNYQDLMVLYPLGDPHIGMAAYVNETGQNWGIQKAKNTYLKMFDRLVKSAPHAEQCCIVNLGDFFHADNISGTTARSGHHLDTDSNYMNMIDAGMSIMVYMIEMALTHHEQVRVINAIGNHDDCASMFLQVALDHMFQDNPRVKIDKSAEPAHYIRFGKCLYGVHHGHTMKADKLPLVMAADRAQDWGETEFRSWLTGHIHHDTLKEYTGCTVETFRTMSPKDNWANWGGYRSDRDSKVLVLHKDYGEIERHTINIRQLG